MRKLLSFGLRVGPVGGNGMRRHARAVGAIFYRAVLRYIIINYWGVVLVSLHSCPVSVTMKNTYVRCDMRVESNYLIMIEIGNSTLVMVCARLVPWSPRKPLPCLHIHSARGIRTASLIDTRSKRQTHRAPASPRRQGAESREPGAGSP